MNLYLPNRYSGKRRLKRLKDTSLGFFAALFLLSALPVVLVVAVVALTLMGVWWAQRAARVPFVRLARRRRGLPRPAVSEARAMELAVEEHRRRSGRDTQWDCQITEHVDCYEVQISTAMIVPGHTIRIDCFTGETLAYESDQSQILVRPAAENGSLLRPAQNRRQENREALLHPLEEGIERPLAG